jgi:hypothetical protein
VSNMTRDVAKLAINVHTDSGGNGPIYPSDFDIVKPEKSGVEKDMETLILKDSWPLSTRATEGEMFQQLTGHFGLPRVIDSYVVSGSDDDEDRTDSIFPSNASFSPLWDETPDIIERENRVHMRILISTQGKPLRHARGPKEMTLGVLHAMLGG